MLLPHTEQKPHAIAPEKPLWERPFPSTPLLFSYDLMSFIFLLPIKGVAK